MTARSPLHNQNQTGSVAATARHMADAVGYLRRVAMEAGLRRIAGKLANVRTNLLNVSAGVSENEEDDHPKRDAGAPTQSTGEEGDGKRKVF
jgi:hypothetical protein